MSRSSDVPPIQPLSHWTSLGFSERAAEDLKSLVEQLHDHCIQHNNSDLLLVIILHHTPLPYHEDLLPHWEMFLQMAIIERSHFLTSIYIKGVRIPAIVANELGPALQTLHRLKRLSIRYVDLDADSLRCISQAVATSTVLEELELDGNEMRDLDAVTSLSSAIRGHPSLRSLSFQQCALGDDDAILFKLLDGCKNGPHRVSLSYNGIRSSGAAIISDFIASNPSVTHLDLSSNQIGDESIPELTSALRTNLNLLELNMHSNSFSDHGHREMYKALLDVTSLSSIVGSAHHCWLRLDDPIGEERIQNTINRSEEGTVKKIRAKILVALYSIHKGQNDLNYLKDVPRKIVPHALAMIQEQVGCKHPFDENERYIYSTGKYLNQEETEEQRKELESDSLSRVFGFVRGFVPLLFDSRSTIVNPGGK